MPPKGYARWDRWGDASDYFIAYDPMAGVKEYTSQMQSIHDLPIPGLERPKPVPVVQAHITPNHRRFRDE